MLMNKFSLPQDMVMGDDVLSSMLSQCAPGDTECVMRVLLGLVAGGGAEGPGEPGSPGGPPPGGGGGGGGGIPEPPIIPGEPSPSPEPTPSPSPTPEPGNEPIPMPGNPDGDLLSALAQNPEMLEMLMQMLMGGRQTPRRPNNLVWGGGGGPVVP